MTDEQIRQNAETAYPGFEDLQTVYIEGAHSRDEEIEELKNEASAIMDEASALKVQLDKLRNPWISVKDRLPEKARGLYELEEDEKHKMVLFKTAYGRSYIGYMDAEEIWRAFTVPHNRACPIDSFTSSKVTHWMPIPELL